MSVGRSSTVRGTVSRCTVASASLALLWACASSPPADSTATTPTSPVPRGSAKDGEPQAVERATSRPSSDDDTDSTGEGAPNRRRVTIGASGDVLVHLKVVRSAREHADVGGFRHVFGDLRGVIGEDEIAFANLETPLSERVPPETGDPPVLGAPAEVAGGLAAAGIDVVSLANNHAYDQTALGLADTLAALGPAGVRPVGAGPTVAQAEAPTIVERDGVRVAFLAFTERINRGPASRPPAIEVGRFDRARVAPAIAAARASADVVVVSVHWSHDFFPRPMDRQREHARWLVAQGADLILGHGPHVLQEVERLDSPRGQAVCAYSLGNLVSNQALRYRTGYPVPTSMHPAVVMPATRDGAWLRVRLALEGGRVQVEALEAVPLWTHNNFLRALEQRVEPRLDIRARPLRDADGEVRAERLPFIERALGPAVRLAL